MSRTLRVPDRFRIHLTLVALLLASSTPCALIDTREEVVMSSRYVAVARRLVISAVVLLTVPHLGQTVVSAEPFEKSPHFPIAAENSNTSSVENVIPGALDAQFDELLGAAEVGCEKGKLDPSICRLSNEQIRAVPTDMKVVESDLIAAIQSDPQANATSTELHDVAAPASIARVTELLRRAIRASNNPTVRKLTDKANDFATWASRATVAGSALAENTAEDYARAAIYLAASATPPVGDLISLAEAISTEDVEQGIVAVVSLSATAIALIFPPAGAVVAAGVAVYNLGKFLFNYFLAKTRDWIKQPPGTPEELFQSGAEFKWTSYPFKGQKVNILLTDDKFVTTANLIMNSKWTEYNRDRRPVKYTIPSGDKKFYGGGAGGFDEISITIWQDGKAATSECTKQGSTFSCSKLSRPVEVSLEKPAALEMNVIAQKSKELSFCKKEACITGTHLIVSSEGTEDVSIPFILGVGYK
ncbi:hypothetical protein NDR87_33825 [Nocardia sp. CDC159]|uniref:Uncharacterized protein n=1 Tax=Nocardia pulmonis TaxID=2951408 RepID=A0A9X2IZU3_9NOCA|nr:MULTISPECIES: hypothetical protein [Nocardia]MCM6778477.1 hypothetical protein [Nocardia pulmonis]MCM6791366.1 hypothetical protein [Nocardia sp. CDC159]